ncbi:hypothetical protein Taro_025772 [Colocasia esculenta]|uniref:Uncharacterized protein n=1 Tax=Colocasia esculenta TaxID=4460 RepID=A0A843VHJ7_COLES|nr:hypothetical protein [Colocasia esculenta]
MQQKGAIASELAEERGIVPQQQKGGREAFGGSGLLPLPSEEKRTRAEGEVAVELLGVGFWEFFKENREQGRERGSGSFTVGGPLFSFSPSWKSHHSGFLHCGKPPFRFLHCGRTTVQVFYTMGGHRSGFLHYGRAIVQVPSLWKATVQVSFTVEGPPFWFPSLWKATVQVSFTIGDHRSGFLHHGRPPFRFPSLQKATVQVFFTMGGHCSGLQCPLVLAHNDLLLDISGEPVPCVVMLLPLASTLLLAPSPSWWTDCERNE